MPAPENANAMQTFAARLRGLQALRPPDVPGAVIVMALGEDPDGRPVTFAGCGLDPGEAFAACVGEAAEWSAQNARETPLAEADPRLPPVEDFGFLLADPAAARGWIAVDELAVSRPARAPRDLFLAGAPLRLPLSHGCAAGPDGDAALAAALCEWVERDAALTWWAGERAARTPGGAAEDAGRAWLAVARGDAADRVTHLLDIGEGSAVPVMVAASFDRQGGGAAFGMKADAEPARAATGALREMAQMEFGLRLAQMKRDRQGEGALTPGDAAILRRAAAIRPDSDIMSRMPRAAAPHPGEGDRDPRRIADRLARTGCRVFSRRLDDAAAIAVARVLVTGLRAPLRDAGDPAPGRPALY